jgi:YHS domain-containing protein
METESLKSLGWLLLWGGFFYLMMRHGCGAHMMSGHGGHRHGDHGGGAPAGDGKDPVCGMPVDPKAAAAAAVRDGRTFYFCSTSCRDKFERAPGKYSGGAPMNGNVQGGHPHG